MASIYMSPQNLKPSRRSLAKLAREAQIVSTLSPGRMLFICFPGELESVTDFAGHYCLGPKD